MDDVLVTCPTDLALELLEGAALEFLIALLSAPEADAHA